VYEYDDAGRMVSSRPEVEWDEAEQAWMLALAKWERDEICALCGWPRSVCRDPMAEFNLEVPLPERCHVITAIDRQKEARAAEGGGKHDDALIWAARFKGERQ
jgi:hypothetical protein